MIYRASIIYVKAVTQAELIHANSRDIDSIFKIHMCNMKMKKVESNDNLITNGGGSNAELNVESDLALSSKGFDPETTKRITQLNSYISIEEKFAQGAQAILKASTTENQKNTANNQLDNFKKNIAEWQEELDMLTGDADPLSSSSRISKVCFYLLSVLVDWKRSWLCCL
jgi:hypothetical protein